MQRKPSDPDMLPTQHDLCTYKIMFRRMHLPSISIRGFMLPLVWSGEIAGQRLGVKICFTSTWMFCLLANGWFQILIKLSLNTEHGL